MKDFKYKQGDTVSFIYKGEVVKGEVISSDKKRVLIHLWYDHKEGNKKWPAGENKYFNKKGLNIFTI